MLEIIHAFFYLLFLVDSAILSALFIGPLSIPFTVKWRIRFARYCLSSRNHQNPFFDLCHHRKLPRLCCNGQLLVQSCTNCDCTSAVSMPPALPRSLDECGGAEGVVRDNRIPLAGQWARDYVPTVDRPLINLSQGVPGHPPPQVSPALGTRSVGSTLMLSRRYYQAFLDRLATASSAPELMTYGDLSGEAGLRKAFAADVERQFGGGINASEVIITAGCNLVRLLS